MNAGIVRPVFLAEAPFLAGDILDNIGLADRVVDTLAPHWRHRGFETRLSNLMAYGITTAEGATLGLASRWTRFLGQMIDGSFAMIPTFVAASVAKFGGAAFMLPLMLVGAAWSFFYLFLGDGLHHGQSFAKQWLGIRVVEAETGKPCTFGRSFVRNIFTILGPLDWIFIFGDAHQRLGDKAAGTMVIVAD